MADQTLLAFDYGLKKIGVAIGNTLLAQARPLAILEPVTRVQRFEQIEALLKEWQPDAVVVGIPLTEEGAEQHASLRCRRFANQLHGRYGLRVHLINEYGSSMEAQQLLGTHETDDAMAAKVILQRWFEAPFRYEVPAL